jgi:hypothetical protein
MAQLSLIATYLFWSVLVISIHAAVRKVWPARVRELARVPINTPGDTRASCSGPRARVAIGTRHEEEICQWDRSN